MFSCLSRSSAVLTIVAVLFLATPQARADGISASQLPGGIHLLAATQCAAPGVECSRLMLQIINGDRSRYGLPPLQLRQRQSAGTGACVGSLGHSLAMAASGSIWHANSSYPRASFPNNICLRFASAGENVGVAEGTSLVRSLRVLNRMMMSEPHLSFECSAIVKNHACTILNPAFRSVGIGILFTHRTTWLTEDFTS